MFVFKVVQQRGKESGVYARSLFLSDKCVYDLCSVTNVMIAILGDFLSFPMAVAAVLSECPSWLGP